MAYFDELLQRAITVRNNRAPASNTADLVGGVLVGIVTALQMLLDDKQDELTFDTAPTADSQNPVTSDGIYQALQAIDLSACEKIVNKVTSINAQSTDVQYPTAKLLYDSLQALSGIYAAIQHTHVAADITDLSTVLADYITTSALATTLADYVTDTDLATELANYITATALATTLADYVTLATAQTISGKKTLSVGVVNDSAYFQSIVTATLSSAAYSIANLKAHTLTLAANVTITLPTVSDGAATLRLKLIQDATGGRSVTFAAASGIKIYNPNETDLSEGAANELCWVTLLWDGTCWVWQSTPYVSPN